MAVDGKISNDVPASVGAGAVFPGVQNGTNKNFAAGLFVLTEDTTAYGRSLADADDAAAARALLDLEPGVDVQAYDADLSAIGALAKTDGNFIVADGSTWTVESGADARSSLGLGSAAVASLTSQATAEAGSDNTEVMTPLRAEQHADAWLGRGLDQTAFSSTPDKTFTHTSFGGAFDSARSVSALRSTGTGTHTGPYFTLSLERVVEGSGTNGPGYADFALWGHGGKSDYLNSTVEGEVGVLYAHATQGRKGDVSGLLVDVAKVRTGSGTETGAGTAIEVYSRIQNASGTDTLAVDTILAFTEAAGGFSDGKGAGVATEARTGTMGIAYAAVDRTDLSAAWEYIHRAFEQRNPSTAYFEVTATGNAGGKGVVRAYGNGNVTYPDFSFTRDTDTGIARGGADVVSIVTGGAARVNVTTTSVDSTLPIAATTYASVSGAAGTSRQIRLMTSGVARWYVAASNETESGANAGSNFLVTRYDDSGVYIDSPLSITRATGVVTLLNGASTNGSYKISATDVITSSRHHRLRSYTVATLPTATAQEMIYVSDGAGGKRLAVADGTNWRFPDGNIVS